MCPLLTLALMVFVMAFVLTTACEHFPLKHVLGCLWTVISGVNETNILAGTDTATVQTFCSDGTFNLTVKCLEDLYIGCSYDAPLKDIAQPTAWQHTFQQLCDSLPVHEAYSDCIVGQRLTIQACLQYNSQLTQKSLHRHPFTEDAFILTICSYFQGLSVCTANPVRDHCSYDVGKLIEDFLMGISPQDMCEEDYIYSARHTPFRHAYDIGMNTSPILRTDITLLTICLSYVTVVI